jgi:hypothetical protein
MSTDQFLEKIKERDDEPADETQEAAEVQSLEKDGGKETHKRRRRGGKNRHREDDAGSAENAAKGDEHGETKRENKPEKPVHDGE